MIILAVALIQSPINSAKDQTQTQTSDLISIKYLIQHKQLGLKNSIQPAQQSLKTSLQTLKKMGISKDDIEVSNYRLKPVYKDIQEKVKFYGFFVTYEVQLTLRDWKRVGTVVDALIGAGVYQIQSIQWIQADQQANKKPEGLVSQAIQIADHLCQKFGLEYQSVSLVQPVQAEQQQKQQEQEQEQEEAEQQQQNPIFKVEVECIQKKGKKKSKL